MTNETTDELVQLLCTLCGSDVPKNDLNAKLFTSGLIDSIGVVELLVYLEERQGIVLSPSQFDREQFDSAQLLLDFIRDRGGKTLSP